MNPNMEAFNENLQALREGKISDVDLQLLKDGLKTPNAEILENLQYAIHGLCITESVKDIPVDFVKQVVDICYTPANIDAMKIMEHLIGTVASVMLFFVRRGESANVIELTKVLDKKSRELKRSLSRSGKAKENLWVVHNCILQASVKQSTTNHDLAISLLLKSLTPLQYITVEDQKLFRKVQKNLLMVFKSFQTYKGKLNVCVEKGSEILRRLSGRSDVNHWFLDVITLKMCFTYTTKYTAEMLHLINGKWKEEIGEILRMTNSTKLSVHWNVVIEFCTKKLPSIQDFLTAVDKILSLSGREEKKRACLLLTALFIPDQLGCHITSFSTENLELLFDYFIVKIYDALPEFRKYAVHSEKWHVCQLETFSFATLTLIHLFRLNFKRGAPKCVSLVPAMVSAFKLASDCLDEMVNNNCGNDIRSLLWAQLVIRVANSIEDIMAICSQNNRWEPLRDLCGCLVPIIAKSNIPLPIERVRLSGMFERWYFACLKMSNVVGSLLARATQIWLCPWDMDWAMTSWVKTKSRDKRLTGYIFCDFLKLYDKDFALDTVHSDAKEFFLAELRAITNDEPLVRCWTAFKALKPNLFESAYALSCLTVSLVRDISPTLTNQYIMECRQHLAELTKISIEQPETKVKSMVYEGMIKFALFSCFLRQSRNKGTGAEARSMVLNLLKAEAYEKAKYGEDVDAHLTCDVLPQSPLLTVTEEATMLAALEKALNAWSPIPDAWVNDACLLDFEITVSFEHIRLIANTAALFGDARLVCKAWVLYYRIGLLVRDPVSQLLAMSMLIKECGMSSDSNLVQKAKECSSALEETDIKLLDQNKVEVLLIFRLALTESFLLSNDYLAAAQTLKNSEEYMRNIRHETEYQTLRGWYLCSISKLLFAAPEMAEFLETRHVQRAAYNAFTSLKSALKIGSDRSLTTKQQGLLLLTMLDVSLWCSDLFFVFLLTPYVRAFLEDLYVICQHLGLTSRTTQLLTLLTQADLASKTLTDAQMKIATLTNMLELSPLAKTKEAIRATRLATTSSTALAQLSPLRCQPQYNNKSPLPMMLPSKLQNSRKHIDSCMCCLCCNGFLQLLTITTRSCEGVAAALAGDNKTAHIYHKHCDDLIENFDVEKFRSILANELAMLFPGEKPLNIQKKFHVVAARSKLNYATFALLPDSHCGELSTKLLQETEKIITGLTFQKNLIEWECLELITCDRIFEEHVKDHAHLTEVIEEVYKQSCSMLTKTPHVTHKNPEAGKALDPCECMETGAPAPKRGRRIFEENGGAKSRIPMVELDDSPPIPNPKTPVDSENEASFPLSPDMKPILRSNRARVARRLKAAPLVFDETQEKEPTPVDNELYDSLEALRITGPVMEKKKPNNGKKSSKKKETSTAKKKPAKTARL